MARKKPGPSCKKRVLMKWPLLSDEKILSHLKEFDNFIEIIVSSDENKYKLGDFTIFLKKKPINTDIIYMCFKKSSSECFVYWEVLKEMVEKVDKLDGKNIYENQIMQDTNLNNQNKKRKWHSEEATIQNVEEVNKRLAVDKRINTDKKVEESKERFVQMDLKKEENIAESKEEENRLKTQQKEKMKKQVENNHSESKEVIFSYGTCNMPYEVLDSLSIKRQFNLTLGSKCTISGYTYLYINTYVNPSSIRTLSYSAEYHLNRYQVNVQTVVKHFYGIFATEYENEFVDEEKHVESIYQSIRNRYNSNINCEFVHPLLGPRLRNYQCQAARWMLECETRNQINDETSILYTELKLQDGTKIFYNKYNGLFVDQFTPLPLFKGGILADEMGLGKTLEVLALILAHQRRDIPKPKSHISIQDGASYSIIEELCSPTEILGSTIEPQIKFECVCGHSYKRSQMETVKCHKCSLVQHAQCVLADTTVEKSNYICPYCWVDSSVEPVKSRATLIVSPSAILHQWEHEIMKHVKPDSLKVFMYLGVENHKFINPTSLADNDIVLTSYEIFRKEFTHVNVPHGKNQRTFRNPKKFRTLPSPLSAVEWWRICLDEAQMVESVSSKVAKMALELHCVNKWCVTGTPIQKSVEDLYGLLLFLGYNPYQEKEWWKKLLCKPFANGATDNLISVLNNILWRTDKTSVLDQLSIPEQETVLHELELCKIERVFYENILPSCQKDFLQKVRQYSCEDSKLKAIDKHVLSKILSPLKKLEQACCHFQLTGVKFACAERCKTTIPELLNHLLKKSSYECEEIHRRLILSLNGLAGTFSLKEEYKSACDVYKKVFLSIEENKETVRTDILQQIHALHNYSEVLKKWIKSVNDVSVIQETIENDNIDAFYEDMVGKCSDFCKTYLIKFEAAVENCKQSLSEISSEIYGINSGFIFGTSYLTNWYTIILNHFNFETKMYVVSLVKQYLTSPPATLHPRSTSLLNSFYDVSGLQYCIMQEMTSLNYTRSCVIQAVRNLITVPTQAVLNNAIECHLRPFSGQQASKCVYCEVDMQLHNYERQLYLFETAIESRDETSTEVDVRVVNNGTYHKSFLESILRIILNLYRSRADRSEIFSPYIHDGENELKLFDTMKKEFKLLRNTWLKIYHHVAALDELEMAKTSMRLLLPGEKAPNPPLPHIIVPHELEGNLLQLESDAISHHHEFKKKMGQLFYLQNLEKAENRCGPFDEFCPVCHLPFEGSWCVLQCGHNFCLHCVQRINELLNIRTNGIRCPVCRGNTAYSDIYYLESRPRIDAEVKGNYSTKVSAIVKTLLKIKEKDGDAKSLVFSSWKNLLSILEHALKQNGINCVSLTDKHGKQFQMAIDEFKFNKSCKVLLLPLKVGANGLNLVEATHVLLSEPVLDQSKILQAVGRVHRIGQKKKTFVHKFVVKNSIEENIYEIHKNDSFSVEDPHETINSSLTVRDLKSLFEVHE